MTGKLTYTVSKNIQGYSELIGRLMVVDIVFFRLSTIGSSIKGGKTDFSKRVLYWKLSRREQHSRLRQEPLQEGHRHPDIRQESEDG